MPDLAEVWSEVLPDIRKGVTGVGVWAALNAAKPVTVEGTTLILGLPVTESELAGHLRLAQTRRLIETEVGRMLGSQLNLRVIDGTSLDDWETEKRRDEEKRRLQEQALVRAKQSVQASSSWEGIYEQLSRQFAATPNRSLPQNRAKFYIEAVALVAQALQETPITDDMAERNFARCIERISQYSEVPSTLVAVRVLEASFQG
ncbi:MAG: hypothetical protein KF884_07825 [Fimbriimonadaceae bacterium]|nr:hypothetical protein [Fimbriimonadaceae bacterium]QYK57458.1 MAG: hypothetical protein KF884_07825 [Fimbriimonadaceae bacterium]